MMMLTKSVMKESRETKIIDAVRGPARLLQCTRATSVKENQMRKKAAKDADRWCQK